MVCLALACGARETTGLAPVAAAQAVAAARPIDNCPLTVDGVRADIETTGRGVAIELSAAPDQLLLLRARAGAAARGAGGILSACPCGAGDAGGPPASKMTLEDFEGGTRLTVSALDPADVRALAAQVRAQLGLVHGGECPKP